MSKYKIILNPFTGKMQLMSSGAALTFKPAVDTVADLPLVGNELNDARITSDTGHLYIWDGTDWHDQGIFSSASWANLIGKPLSTPAQIDNVVNQAVESLPSGDWKQITSMEFNPTTGEVRIIYDT